MQVEEEQVESAGEQEAAEEPQQQDQQAIELPVDEVGEHKGVRSQRNVLGEPDAPVRIEHFGDFT